MSAVETAENTATTTPGQDTPTAGLLPRQRDRRSGGSRAAYRRLHLGAGVVILGALASGLALPGGEAAHDLAGTVQLWQGVSAGAFGTACSGTGADADIAKGAQVRVNDASGALLATTTLGPGRSDGAACVFDFSVPDLASVGGYRIGVGDESRPGTAFTFRQMHADDWDVRVILGA